MIAIVETQSFKYPFRVVIEHPSLRKQGFEYWHSMKERIDCGLDDALDAIRCSLPIAAMRRPY